MDQQAVNSDKKCFICGDITRDPFCKKDGMLTEAMCPKCKECKTTCICKPKTF